MYIKEDDSMAISSVGDYGNVYGSMYASKQKGTEALGKSGTSEASEAKIEDRKGYLSRLQNKVTDVTLETGTVLNMKKDNKIGTLTIHPELLEKMQNDTDAEKKYTQLIKDIERAEQTVGAYYNAIGGVVERSSHWYIDENGKYCHFGYVRRDDKLNKRLREEARKNAAEQIERTRENARKKAEELAESLEKKAAEAREQDKQKEKEESVQALNGTAREKVEKLLLEKLESSEDGVILLDDADIRTIIEAAKEDEANQSGRKPEAMKTEGMKLDIKI